MSTRQRAQDQKNSRRLKEKLKNQRGKKVYTCPVTCKQCAAQGKTGQPVSKTTMSRHLKNRYPIQRVSTEQAPEQIGLTPQQLAQFGPDDMGREYGGSLEEEGRQEEGRDDQRNAIGPREEEVELSDHEGCEEDADDPVDFGEGGEEADWLDLDAAMKAMGLDEMNRVGRQQLLADLAREVEMSKLDEPAFRALMMKLKLRLTRDGFEYLRRQLTDMQQSEIPSEYLILKQLEAMSEIKPEIYDCCIKSCMAFTGPDRDRTKCSYCGEDRFRSDGKPRAVYSYFPIHLLLRILQRNPDYATSTRYRANHQEEDTMQDVYDGKVYEELKRTKVKVGEDVMDHKFFESAVDVALAIFTDGFQPFKKKSNRTCWPVMALNLNLPPSERDKTKNVIPLLIIPGPHHPRDFDSFLYPLYEHARRSARAGHRVYDAVEKKEMIQRFYIILFGGDSPAIAMAMKFKGHTGKRPCRYCKISGVNCSHHQIFTNYFPLTLPHDLPPPPPQNPVNRPSYEPSDVATTLRRTDDEIRLDAAAAAFAVNDNVSKESGINGLSAAADIPGFRLDRSFPQEFMHGGAEGVVKLLIKLFKGDNPKSVPITKSAAWRVSDRDWTQIGDEIEEATSMIPSLFGREMPRIDKRFGEFTAEDLFTFVLHIGPIVLRDRLGEPFYSHFVRLGNWMRKMMGFEIKREDVEIEGKLRKEVYEWVEEYERLYYQYDVLHLPLMKYTIHILLHFPDAILDFGPPYGYWTFAMERYCQHLGKLVKSRRHPDRTMANATLVEIRLTAVVAKHPTFDKYVNPPPVPSAQQNSTRQLIDLEDLTLQSPTTTVSTASNPTFKSHLVGYFATRFPQADGSPAPMTTVKRHLPTEISLWSQVKLDDGRDVVNAAKLLLSENEEPEKFTRDSTYLIYSHLVDKFEDDPDHEVELEEREEIARCEQIFTAVYRGKRFELAWVLPCRSETVEDNLSRFPTGRAGFRQREIIDIRLLRGAVGRVRHGEWYYIVDRSSKTLIPTFDGDLEQAGFAE